MKIDFDKIPEVTIEGFKGVHGLLNSYNFSDEKMKIMYSILKPGASTGLHVHTGSCEVIYVLSGEAVFTYDGKEEIIRVGQCHYCPEGHSHFMENRTTHDLVYFAVVPTFE